MYSTVNPLNNDHICSKLRILDVNVNLLLKVNADQYLVSTSYSYDKRNKSTNKTKCYYSQYIDQFNFILHQNTQSLPLSNVTEPCSCKIPFTDYQID